ncbi:MAG TPA: HEAT repeat domain-containing protein [Phycisphaerales bacterium]|nr:HEAT repeat domain-containing protein [Phycisphaerales bacterium]
MRCGRAGAGALLVAMVILGGCKASDMGGKGAKETDTIFEMFSPPTPAEAAAWAADPYDADKRARGILMLANAPWGGERVYVDLYRAAVNDGDPGVRAVAVRALSLHGSPEDVAVIVEQLPSNDRLLRWEAARALQRLHHPDAIDPLIQAIDPKHETDEAIRAECATALGQYAEGKVLDALISAMGDHDLGVNRAALESLRTLTGADHGYDVRAWVAWRGEVEQPFAGRTAYIYPVFHRDPTWVEKILPFWKPPNEIAAAPVGMTNPVGAGPSASTGSGEPASDQPVRNN